MYLRPVCRSTSFVLPPFLRRVAGWKVIEGRFVLTLAFVRHRQVFESALSLQRPASVPSYYCIFHSLTDFLQTTPHHPHHSIPAKYRVYTEKEIVALSTKAGVNGNTCADVNQALVDDGLVDKAKIGGSNYFWSFPGKKDRLLQLKHEENLATIEKIGPVIAEAETKLADAKRGREDEEEGAAEGEDRKSKLQKLDTLAKETKAATEELAKLKENDPQALADLDHELKLVYQAAERWTDNIFNCKSYLTKKRSMSSKEANRLLGISDAFDYPEMPKMK